MRRDERGPFDSGGATISRLDPDSHRSASSTMRPERNPERHWRRLNRSGFWAELQMTAPSREAEMAESVYKVIELVGTSTESWEMAAKAVVERAAHSLRDMRVAEVIEQDLVIENGKVEAYRTKLKVSFKYEGKD